MDEGERAGCAAQVDEGVRAGCAELMEEAFAVRGGCAALSDPTEELLFPGEKAIHSCFVSQMVSKDV